MRFLYAGLALTLVALTFLSSAMFFREPRLERAAFALFSLLGCGLLIPLLIRAWRRKPVDDRLILIFGFSFYAFRAFIDYAKKREAADLIFGSLARLVSLGTLIAFLRHPSLPPPEPEAEERISGPFKPLPDSPGENSIGCAPWGGLLLLLGSFVGYVILRGSPAIWTVTGGIGVALLFSGLIRRDRR